MRGAIIEAVFRNRKEAGQLLAGRLASEGFVQPLVLARTASVVPIAFEVALALDAPLELLPAAQAALAGRSVIVVDEGLRWGGALPELLAELRRKAPRRIVVAVPVAEPEAIRELGTRADRVVALLRPKRMRDAGTYYAEFGAPSDEAVSALLERRR